MPLPELDAAAGLRALVAAAAAGARLGRGEFSDPDPLRALLSDPTLGALFNAPAPTDTPVQQTRSGRISRPPVVHAQLQELSYGSRPVHAGPGGRAHERAQVYAPATNGDTCAPARREPKRARVVSPPNSDAGGEAGTELEHERHRQTHLTPAGSEAHSPGEAAVWPATGGGKRPRMEASEVLERRRARNRKAADTSRRKKKAEMDELKESLRDKTAECNELERHCTDLEARVQQLERYIASAGLRVPVRPPAPARRTKTQPAPMSIDSPMQPETPVPAAAAAPALLPAHLSADSPPASAVPAGLLALPSGLDVRNSVSPVPSPRLGARAAAGLGAGGDSDTPGSLLTDDDGTPMLSFDALFNIDYDSAADENDAADGDFVPPTSPAKHSSDISDDDASDAGDGAGRAERIEGLADGGDGGESGSGSESEGSDDEADEEEEDLFLPIEDVPVPVDELYDDAMRNLGVRTREELATVVRGLVESAGKGARAGVSTDQVEALRRVIMLAEKQGIYHVSG
ncbi:hypothetical protein Q5752_001788 [Cryptotrichosporon argae]